MEMNEISRTSPPGLTHFVDIHEVPEEEEEGEEDEEQHGGNKVKKMAETRFEKAINLQETKTYNKSFSRQVSLETGFSALNGEKTGRKSLPRSGNSFGGFGSAYRSGAEGRKGDYSMFRTKSSLVRQNSKLPSRKESGIDDQYNEAAGGHDESVNESVPAGRYFAALTGPELDQVKVYP